MRRKGVFLVQLVKLGFMHFKRRLCRSINLQLNCGPCKISSPKRDLNTMAEGKTADTTQEKLQTNVPLSARAHLTDCCLSAWLWHRGLYIRRVTPPPSVCTKIPMAIAITCGNSGDQRHRSSGKERGSVCLSGADGLARR